jgi:hypothetical protein
MPINDQTHLSSDMITVLDEMVDLKPLMYHMHSALSAANTCNKRMGASVQSFENGTFEPYFDTRFVPVLREVTPEEYKNLPRCKICDDNLANVEATGKGCSCTEWNYCSDCLIKTVCKHPKGGWATTFECPFCKYESPWGGLFLKFGYSIVSDTSRAYKRVRYNSSC